MIVRLHKAATDIKEKADRELCLLPEQERLETACQIVLITWLISDPDAHNYTPELTGFQKAGFSAGSRKKNEHELELLELLSAGNDTGTAVRSPLKLDDRFQSRVAILEDFPEWKAWTEWAVAELKSLNLTKDTNRSRTRKSTAGRPRIYNAEQDERIYKDWEKVRYEYEKNKKRFTGANESKYYLSEVDILKAIKRFERRMSYNAKNK